MEDTRARGSTALGAERLDKLRERYDTATSFGITHNRLRDWHEGNHPGYALGCWLRDYKEQVFLFTRDFAVDWTNNVNVRARRQSRQAAPGRLRILAHPRHPRPLVPHQKLPRLSRRPPHYRTRRYPRRTHRKTLATATAHRPRHPVNGHPRTPANMLI